MIMHKNKNLIFEANSKFGGNTTQLRNDCITLIFKNQPALTNDLVNVIRDMNNFFLFSLI